MINPGALSFWIDNDYLIHIQVEQNRETSEQLEEFFNFGFKKRDSRYGKPCYQRFNPNTNTYTTTKWELAQSFFTHFKSKEFETLMLKHATDPDNPMKESVAKQITSIDDYLHYGYVFNSQRGAGKYHFWQFYAPNYSTKQLKKIIPNRFQSKTKVRGLHIPQFVSPILIQRQKEKALKKLSGQSLRSEQNIDDITLKVMQTKDKTNANILQAKFYRRWHHPILILDNTNGTKGHSPTMNNLEMVLDALTFDYPILNNSFYTSQGKPKDFDAEYLFGC